MIFHAINKNISQIELDFYINDEKIEIVNRFKFIMETSYRHDL